MTDQLSADELGDGPADATTDETTDQIAPLEAPPDPGAEADTKLDDAIPAPTTSPHRFGRGPKRHRISKWDRPPEPHDWRFFVGNLGKVLIATGLLLFGFVAYQLWGTGIETARAQHRLEDQFDQLLVDSGIDVDREGSPAVTVASSEGTDRPDAAGDEGDEGDEGDDDRQIVAGDVTEGIPVALDLSDEAVAQTPIPQPFRGDPLLRLQIPAIGRDDIVVPGVALNDLKDGPGHYPDTPLPGQLGNASIAGHRTTYGAPFFNVDQLRAGDEIIATLLNGDRFVYEVTFVEVVSASDYWVVTTRDPNIAELTLTSCDPKYTARDRIVVHSVLNPEKSSNVGFPTFYTLDPAPDDTPIPGDDPVLSADGIDITGPNSALGELEQPSVDPTVTDLDPTNGESPDQPNAAADSGDDQPPEIAAAQAATADSDPIDAFSQGWFDDRGAFPQVALWGLALAIIALLAHQVSKKFRNSFIGVLVGIAPFLFALYFFYQNINRLLPPGI